MKVDVSLNERVLVYVDGQPRQYLVPGRYRLWIAPWRKVEVKRLDTDKLVADLRAEDLALIPAEDLRVLSLGPYERALVSRRGKPARWIGPGQVQVWTAEREAIAVEIYQIPGVEAAPLRDEVKALVPNTDYVEATAADGFTVVRYVDGAIDAVLGPGRAAAWTAKRKVQLVCIELRERLLAVTGQEVMTRDRVSLRLNLTAGYRVADVRRLLTVARAADEVLYLAVQLASREAVATRTLDELLAAREELGAALKAAVAERAAAVGLQLLDLGLKDLVLPGEMKALLNRVIEAQKEAEANVILRREETAATRSMAQTAKVLAENPLLVRLKELEAYKELASKVGTVNLVLGESVLPQLQLKA
ncbi:MAG TPA: slipin family protein [Myxococcales bacterium]|nr:slipin family protein [Myxococcales bacterium]